MFDREGASVHERAASPSRAAPGTAGAHARNVATYEEYTQDHEYTHDSGLVVLPVASRTPAHKVIRLHGGVGMRIVKWKAARAGKPPVVPRPVNTAGDTVLGSVVHAQLPAPQVQAGNYLFRMNGTYTYVQDVPRIVGENALPTGCHPYQVQPMDAMASGYVLPVMSQFEPPETTTEFDTMIAAIDDAVRQGRGTEFSWPLTVIPASFNEVLIQG